MTHTTKELPFLSRIRLELISTGSVTGILTTCHSDFDDSIDSATEGQLMFPNDNGSSGDFATWTSRRQMAS
ncbi:MAG: hypothetical protein ACK50J_02505 [Planctomyces sp.]